MPELTPDQLSRYQRNILLPHFGREGQKKLMQSKVLVTGAGGLGSPILFYLTAAGVGEIGVIDSDAVDLSNLQRQILHSTADLGRPKVESAFDKLTALSPDSNIVIYHQRLNENNAPDIISGYQLVIDATDNFATRQLLNKLCVQQGKPFIYGGVLAYQGQVMTFVPGKGPCFSCIFRNQPPAGAPTTSELGILGSVAGTIGCIEATEAVKLLLGIGEPLVGRMFTIDLLTMQFAEIEIKQDENCPVCGQKRD